MQNFRLSLVFLLFFLSAVAYSAVTISSIAPNLSSPLGGTLITVTGTDFGSTSSTIAFLVDGQPCTNIQIITASTAFSCRTPAKTTVAGTAITISLTTSLGGPITDSTLLAYSLPFTISPSEGAAGATYATAISITVAAHTFAPTLNISSTSISQYKAICRWGPVPGSLTTMITATASPTVFTCPLANGLTNGANTLFIDYFDGNLMFSGAPFTQNSPFSASPMVGITGTVLTIQGYTFTAGDKLCFGTPGAASTLYAPVVQVSATVFTATAPTDPSVTPPALLDLYIVYPSNNIRYPKMSTQWKRTGVSAPANTVVANVGVPGTVFEISNTGANFIDITSGDQCRFGAATSDPRAPIFISSGGAVKTCIMPTGSYVAALNLFIDGPTNQPKIDMGAIIYTGATPTPILQGTTGTRIRVVSGGNVQIGDVLRFGSYVSGAPTCTFATIPGGYLQCIVPAGVTPGSVQLQIEYPTPVGNLKFSPSAWTMVPFLGLPTAVINGPSVVGICDDIVLSGLASSSPMGALVTYKWTITGTSVPAPILASVAAATGSSLTILASAALPADFYTFTLIVEDVYNLESAATSFAVQQSSSILPVVTLLSPSYVSIRRSDPLPIHINVRGSTCAASVQLSTSWSCLRVPASSPTSDCTPLITSFNPSSASSLYFPPNALPADSTYVFRAQSCPTGVVGAACGSAQMNVTVSNAPLVASIAGGCRSIFSASALILDASASFDPDSVATAATYSWSCTDLIYPAVPCPLSLTSPLFTTPQSSPILTIPASTYTTGSSLRFTLTYSKGMTRNSTASVRIRVVPAYLPIVGILPESSNRYVSTVFPYNVPISLRGYITSDISKVTRVGWRETSANSLSLSSSSSVSKSSDGMSLYIAAGYLAAGQTYTFRFSAFSALGEGYAEQSITIASPPSSGRCSTSPNNGTTSTQFTMRCTGWVAATPDATPLTYTFAYQYMGSNETFFLSKQRLSPYLQVNGLAGQCGRNGTLIMLSTIADSLGSQVTVSDTVFISALSSDFFNNRASYLSNETSTDVDAALRYSDYSSVLTVSLLVSQLMHRTCAPPPSTSTDFTTYPLTTQEIELAQNRLSLAQSLARAISSSPISSEVVQQATTAIFNIASSPREISIGNTSQIILTILSDFLKAAANTSISSPSPIDSNAAIYSVWAMNGVLGTSAFGTIDPSAATSSINTTTLSPSEASTMRSSAHLLDSSIGSLATGLRTSLLPGSPALRITSSNIIASFSSDLLPALVGRTLATSPTASNSSVQLPSSLSLPSAYTSSGNASRALVAQQVEISRNPYAFANSRPLASPLVDFTLRDSISGQVLNISNSTAPILITIPLSQSVASGFIPSCVFWNPSTETWSSAGCTLSSYTNQTAVCACNHLTQFATQFVPRINNVADISLSAFTEFHPAATIVVSVLYGSFFLLLIPAIYLDRRDKKLVIGAPASAASVAVVASPKSSKNQITPVGDDNGVGLTRLPSKLPWNSSANQEQQQVTPEEPIAAAAPVAVVAEDEDDEDRSKPRPSRWSRFVTGLKRFIVEFFTRFIDRMKDEHIAVRWAVSLNPRRRSTDSLSRVQLTCAMWGSLTVAMFISVLFFGQNNKDSKWQGLAVAFIAGIIAYPMRNFTVALFASINRSYIARSIVDLEKRRAAAGVSSTISASESSMLSIVVSSPVPPPPPPAIAAKWQQQQQQQSADETPASIPAPLSANAAATAAKLAALRNALRQKASLGANAPPAPDSPSASNDSEEKPQHVIPPSPSAALVPRPPPKIAVSPLSPVPSVTSVLSRSRLVFPKLGQIQQLKQQQEDQQQPQQQQPPPHPFGSVGGPPPHPYASNAQAAVPTKVLSPKQQAALERRRQARSDFLSSFMRVLFDRADIDSDGRISLADVKRALMSSSEDEDKIAETAFNSMTSNGDATITFDEWARACFSCAIWDLGTQQATSKLVAACSDYMRTFGRTPSLPADAHLDSRAINVEKTVQAIQGLNPNDPPYVVATCLDNVLVSLEIEVGVDHNDGRRLLDKLPTAGVDPSAQGEDDEFASKDRELNRVIAAQQQQYLKEIESNNKFVRRIDGFLNSILPAMIPLVYLAAFLEDRWNEITRLGPMTRMLRRGSAFILINCLAVAIVIGALTKEPGWVSFMSFVCPWIVYQIIIAWDALAVQKADRGKSMYFAAVLATISVLVIVEMRPHSTAEFDSGDSVLVALAVLIVCLYFSIKRCPPAFLRSQRMKLPRWMRTLGFAYSLVAILQIIYLFFTITFVVKFEEEIQRAFFLAFSLAFVQDIIVLEPAKIALSTLKRDVSAFGRLREKWLKLVNFLLAFFDAAPEVDTGMNDDDAGEAADASGAASD